MLLRLKEGKLHYRNKWRHRARGDIYFQTQTWVIWWETQLDNRIDNLKLGLIQKTCQNSIR